MKKTEVDFNNMSIVTTYLGHHPDSEWYKPLYDAILLFKDGKAPSHREAADFAFSADLDIPDMFSLKAIVLLARELFENEPLTDLILYTNENPKGIRSPHRAIACVGGAILQMAGVPIKY